MNTTSRWYPAKDRCVGSFRTLRSGNQEVSADGKWRVQCPWCKRFVGIRTQGRMAGVVLAQHRAPAPENKEGVQ